MSMTATPLRDPPCRERAASSPEWQIATLLAWEEPCVEQSVPRLRRAVRSALAHQGLANGALADCLLLAVSELATNVVIHAACTKRVCVHLQLAPERVQLVVMDDDPCRPATGAQLDPQGECGRGLQLIRALVGEQGGSLVCTPLAAGKCMVVTLPR